MIRTAIFALNQDEANQYIEQFHLPPEEVRFIETAEDIEDLTDPEIVIVMHGTYYDRGEAYQELADTLQERLRNGKAKIAESTEPPAEPTLTTAPDEDPPVPVTPDGGTGEGEAVGEPSEIVVPDAREDGQGQQSGGPGDVADANERPNLPRRKPNATETKS